MCDIYFLQFNAIFFFTYAVVRTEKATSHIYPLVKIRYILHVKVTATLCMD
jgi:hypothetical protein